MGSWCGVRDAGWGANCAGFEGGMSSVGDENECAALLYWRLHAEYASSHVNQLSMNIYSKATCWMVSKLREVSRRI